MESGEINYEKIVYENDITFANSKWMQPRLFKNDQIKKARTLQIAIMTGVEMVGLEEILRQLILDRQREAYIDEKKKQKLSQHYIDRRVKELFDDPTTKVRDFTCRVKSLKAVVFFLKLDEFNNIMRQV